MLTILALFLGFLVNASRIPWLADSFSYLAQTRTDKNMLNLSPMEFSVTTVLQPSAFQPHSQTSRILYER